MPGRQLNTASRPSQNFPSPEERYGAGAQYVRLLDYEDPPGIGLFIVGISYTQQTGAFGVRVLGHPPGNYTKPPTFPLPKILKAHLRQMAHAGQTARHSLGLRIDLTRESRGAWTAAISQAVGPMREGTPGGNTSPGRSRRNLKKGLRQRDEVKGGQSMA